MNDIRQAMPVLQIDSGRRATRNGALGMRNLGTGKAEKGSPFRALQDHGELSKKQMDAKSMSHIVLVNLRCDLCGKEFEGSQSSVANLYGKTKGTPLRETRAEAKADGWTRLDLNRHRPSRSYQKIDVCPECRDLPIPAVLWFEVPD